MDLFGPTKSAMLIALLGVLERFVIDAGGILSIFLGFRLFFVSELKSEAGGKFSSQLFNLSLTKVGPGVFFALFGAYILATTLNRPIKINQQVDLAGMEETLSRLAEDIHKLPDGEAKRILKTDLDGLSKTMQ